MSTSSRPEAAFVLLLMQATFWLLAGISGLPFVLGGEVFMLLLASISIALAAVTVVSAVFVVRRSRWARRTILILESLCVLGSLLLFLLPLGANRGPVSLLVNLVLPLAVIALLAKRYGISGASAG